MHVLIDWSLIDQLSGDNKQTSTAIADSKKYPAYTLIVTKKKGLFFGKLSKGDTVLGEIHSYSFSTIQRLEPLIMDMIAKNN
jgi:hypothetical protein